MPGDNGCPGEFQLDGERSFCPTICYSSYAGNSHLHCRSRDADNHHGYPGQWRDVYGQSFTDLQLNDVQLNRLRVCVGNHYSLNSISKFRAAATGRPFLVAGANFQVFTASIALASSEGSSDSTTF